MFEIIEKVRNNISLTEDETKKFLSYICDFIRKDSNILDPMDSDCKKCNETSLKFGQSMIMEFGCNVDRIDIKNKFEIPLTHFANTVSLNVNDSLKTYLVDMTYSQFFGDIIILDNEEVVTTEVFNAIKEEVWVKNLRQNGFVELTDDIEDVYFSTFVNLCKSKSLD